MMTVQIESQQNQYMNTNKQQPKTKSMIRKKSNGNRKKQSVQQKCKYTILLIISFLILMMYSLLKSFYFQSQSSTKYQNNIEVLRKSNDLSIKNNQTDKKLQTSTNINLIQQLKNQYQIYSKSQNGIDYENYTGITNSKLSNTLLWRQLKQQNTTKTNEIANIQRTYYDQQYNLYRYPQLPICVVITTYNNAQNFRHIDNINSILMQEYTNYRIIFIDDASTDSTLDDVVKIMMHQQKLNISKYTVIQNSKRQQKMYNLRMAANQYCQPKDIFLAVDGDDQLVGRQVFKLFNSIFQEEQAWFVYSNFITLNNYIGLSRFIPKEVINYNNYRTYPFVTSHLRAFYTQLFRNIREEDLKDSKGQYFKTAVDIAICLPILEQAQQRIFYLPELTYFFNPLISQFEKRQQNELYIRSLPKYKRLQNLLP